MNRGIILGLAFAMVAGLVRAETDYIALRALDAIRAGEVAGAITNLNVDGEADISGNLYVGGNEFLDGSLGIQESLSVAGGTFIAGTLDRTAALVVATNGHEIAVTSSVIYANASGQANGFTNTCTVADPGAVGLGRTFILMNSAVATNLLALAESDANLELGAATRELGPNDSVILWAYSVTNWVEIGYTDN